MKSKPWITTVLRVTINIKNLLFKKYMTTKSTYYHTKFKLYRNKLNHLLKVSKNNYKQLLDEVFVVSGIIKVEVSVIITLTETLIIPDITKTESNNCFIIHCFKENNDKRIIAANTVYFAVRQFTSLSVP